MARLSASPRSALSVGSVLTSAVVAVWFAGGLGYGATLGEVWLMALGGAAVLSASLLAGSAVLVRLSAGPGAGEA